MAREVSDQKEFVSILASDGSFRLKVPKGTEGAVEREYENSDKEMVTKNEIVFKALSGKVTGVAFSETKFGNLLQVTITDEEGDLTISTNASSNFGIDIMKKLPSMDFSKEYRFAPFSFEGENGKNVRGVSISEGLEFDKEATKMQNFFYDSKKTEDINGFPESQYDAIMALTEGKRKNKWKAYFGEIEDFLVDYTEKEVMTKLVVEDTKEEKEGEEEF